MSDGKMTQAMRDALTDVRELGWVEATRGTLRPYFHAAATLEALGRRGLLRPDGFTAVSFRVRWTLKNEEPINA